MGIPQSLKEIGKRALVVPGLVLILNSLAGCATFNYKVPETGFYNEIKYNRPYIRGIYDCTEKSRDYFNHLAAKGYRVKCHVGHVEGDKKNHSWVTYKDEDGIERLLEPTKHSVISGYPVEHYPKYETHSIRYESHPEPKTAAESNAEKDDNAVSKEKRE